MNQIIFGKTNDGQDVFLTTLENDNLIIKTMNYGATIVSIIDKATGIDIIAGFNDVQGYINNSSYIGACIGRTANRIKNGKFTLNNKEYQLSINDNDKNHLHGGSGFNTKLFDIRTTDNSVTYHRVSPNLEDGYPGNLDVSYTYTLLNDGVEMKAEGISDEDTLFSFTSHTYFNLDESDSIKDHIVKINASEYADCDDDGISVEKHKSVENTHFDFREFKRVGDDMDSSDPQLVQNRNGYDHHFMIQGTGMREFAVCKGQKLTLTVSSDLPGMHMYTSNFTDEKDGKNGKLYPPHSLICFEPEYYPNAINYPTIEPKPILRKGEKSVQRILLNLKQNA